MSQRRKNHSKEFKARVALEAVKGVRPVDSPMKRAMVADSILDDIKPNNGVFPERNAFIERAWSGAGRNPGGSMNAQ